MGQPSDEGCFLCAKAQATMDEDRENLVLFRGQLCFVILNLYPYSNGHMMIAPYEHLGDLERLAPEAMAEMMALAAQSVAALRESMSADGCNLGMNLGRVAGAGLADHIHLHVVPRWHGDTNFMTVLNQTRLVPEALLSTYDRLLPYFQQNQDRKQQ